MLRALGTAVVCLAVARPVDAAKVVLKISAVNPSDKLQRKAVRSNLPNGVGTNDVITLDGMELRYDVKNDLYYVYREVDLAPRARVDFRVEIEDVWVISAQTLEKFQKHAEKLAKMLNRTDFASLGEDCKNGIVKSLVRIRDEQNKCSLASGAKPLQHIRAYYANLDALQDVRNRLGHLENLALGAGQDPGELLGAEKETPKPDRSIEPAPGEYKEVVYQIRVHNPSATVARKVKVQRDLPREIRANDVLDGGGLEAATDARREVCYLFKEDVEIGPGETVTFNVRIRDRWNINARRILSLKERAQEVRNAVTPMGIALVCRAMADLLAEIDDVEKEPLPAMLDDRYVDFFRGQAKRLDQIEERLYRVKLALRESQPRKGFGIKAPSRRTVWLIIYIILGFLAVVSLLFFLRWYGRSKAEKIDIA
ncbi:MAG: hypothetical protein QME60_03970 [Verrucomicrobiota bacterium]|nr:hypothetical protein [Verrucomicrobiota bacterium]